MQTGKIVVIRSADSKKTFIETIPDKRGEDTALILNDDQVEDLIAKLQAYHRGETRRVVIETKNL